jgi:hypothetical protein
MSGTDVGHVDKATREVYGVAAQLIQRVELENPII